MCCIISRSCYDVQWKWVPWHNITHIIIFTQLFIIRYMPDIQIKYISNIEIEWSEWLTYVTNLVKCGWKCLAHTSTLTQSWLSPSTSNNIPISIRHCRTHIPEKYMRYACMHEYTAQEWHQRYSYYTRLCWRDSCFLPGIVTVCVVPCRSRRTGGTAVVGEELILPLSALGERSPLTRISQPPPPWTNPIQSPPVNLHSARRWGEKLNELPHGLPSLILCRKETTCGCIANNSL